MANTFDNIPEWNGDQRDDDDDTSPAPPLRPVPLDGQKLLPEMHQLLLIGGTLSGQKMHKVGALDQWEIIHCFRIDRLEAYQQDKPGSENYFFNKAKTAWLNEHRETIVRKLGDKMQQVDWVEQQP